MQLIEAFNPLDHNPEQSAGQLPVGRHPVVAIDAEVKATKNNDGGLIEFTLSIIDGPCKGQSGAYRINLYNASQKAVEIAKRQLSALCYATGRFQLGQNGTDLTPLLNVPFIVEVAPQAQNEQYTEITKVFDINGNAPKAQGGNTQQQAPAQQTGGFAQQQPQNNAPATGGFGGGFTQQTTEQQPQQQTAWGGAGNTQTQAPAGNTKPAWAK